MDIILIVILDKHSEHLLFVIFKFQYKWLDILASILPSLNRLLCIRVEVFLLLIEESLSSCCLSKILFKLLFSFLLFNLHLPSMESLELLTSESLLFLFLLLCDNELLVSYLPEFTELFLIICLLESFLLLSINLLLS